MVTNQRTAEERGRSWLAVGFWAWRMGVDGINRGSKSRERHLEVRWELKNETEGNE